MGHILRVEILFMVRCCGSVKRHIAYSTAVTARKREPKFKPTKTPLISPSWTSYGVSLTYILRLLLASNMQYSVANGCVIYNDIDSKIRSYHNVPKSWNMRACFERYQKSSSSQRRQASVKWYDTTDKFTVYSAWAKNKEIIEQLLPWAPDEATGGSLYRHGLTLLPT